MNCHSVQDRLSEYLDGRLSEAQRQRILAHLDGCPDCALLCAQLAHTRRALKRLPVLVPPAYLTDALRVIASRERFRRLTYSDAAAWFAHWAGHVRLWVDNLMRPVALPFAGGLISAIILFSMLVPSVLFQRSVVNDVPLERLFREAAVASPAPFGFNQDHFILEVTVDRNGRMVDYRITEGEELIRNPALRRAIENYVLFTGFSPATAFGQPTYGKVTVSFSRYQFNVGS